MITCHRGSPSHTHFHKGHKAQTGEFGCPGLSSQEAEVGLEGLLFTQFLLMPIPLCRLPMAHAACMGMQLAGMQSRPVLFLHGGMWLGSCCPS